MPTNDADRLRAAPWPGCRACRRARSRPVICVVIAAASRSRLAANITLKPIQGPVAPVSAIVVATNSAVRASSASAAFSRIARRAFGPVSAQAGKRRRGRLDRAVDVGAAAGRGAGGDRAGDRVQSLEARLVRRTRSRRRRSASGYPSQASLGQPAPGAPVSNSAALDHPLPPPSSAPLPLPRSLTSRADDAAGVNRDRSRSGAAWRAGPPCARRGWLRVRPHARRRRPRDATGCRRRSASGAARSCAGRGGSRRAG